MGTKSILVVDDEPSMRMALSESLESCGYEVETSIDGVDALKKFQKGNFDVVITDMTMPKMGGMEVLRDVKKFSSRTPVIIITAYGTVNTAVEAMKEGAYDFIMKPFSLDHLEGVVTKVVARRKNDADLMCESDGSSVSDKAIITNDNRMISLLNLIKSVAKSKSSILIQGESGTGKEMIARYIHQCSNRANKPFIAVNCAAIPHNLLESEMFGYEKGAFTGASQKKLGKFELADSGTLLLDEISEMDIQLQAKFLRVIQESQVDRLGGKTPVSVDVRIIATTNVDLKNYIEEKKFRGDLYYRLNVIPIKTPSLRERKGDIAVLSEYFLDKYSRLNGIKKPSLSKQVMAILKGYDWPGNVRELENVIERSLLISGDDTILPEHLYLDAERVRVDNMTNEGHEKEINFESFAATDVTLRDMERKLIFETLKKVNGNKMETSRILGVSVRTIRNKLNEYKNDGAIMEETESGT